MHTQIICNLLKMFIDHLTIEQTFDHDMPILADEFRITIDTMTGEHKRTNQSIINQRGSYSTKIDIHLTSNRIKMSGNASRYNRPDNLFGFSNIDTHVEIYNEILRDNRLPEFTKCTGVFYRQGADGTKVQKFSDGAIIKRLDLTTNKSVGEACERDYIRALATQRYKKNQIGYIYPDGNTADWRGKGGKVTAREYCKVYSKYPELLIHLLPKTKRLFGEDSPEYKYVQDLAEYVKSQGVVRFEQELKAEFLREASLRYYGLFSHEDLLKEHNRLLNIEQNAGGVKMDIEHISQTLLRKGIVTSVKAANTTSMYFSQWQHGQTFDFTKSQPKLHAARLNKIGIDIRTPFDITRHTDIQVRKVREIEVRALAIPDFYQRPNHLKLVA